MAASFSMILSVASASEDVKASSRSAFHRGNNLKKALKTESENHLGNPRTVNPNDPKTIDYTLYNYGKSFFFWKTTHKQNSEVTKLQCVKKKEVLRRNNTKKRYFACFAVSLR